MNALFAGNGLTILSSITLAGLLGVVGVETDWGKRLHREIPVTQLTGGQASDADLLQAFTLLPPEDISYADFTARSLFVPSRRPTPAAVAVAAVPSMRRGQFQLVGTSVNKDLSVAYLREVATSKTLRVTRGTSINGLLLNVIEPTRVVLKQGDETEELSLKVGASPRNVAPVLTAAGVPQVAANGGPPNPIFPGGFPAPAGGFPPPPGVEPSQPVAQVGVPIAVSPVTQPSGGQAAAPAPTAQSMFPPSAFAPPGAAAATAAPPAIPANINRRGRFQNPTP